MKLVLAKYPRPFKEKRDKDDSIIIYETGQRTFDIGDLQESFDKVVEENEGEEADSWSAEVSLDIRTGMKKVPVTDPGTYPSEFNMDKKVLSETEQAIMRFKPSAKEVLSMANKLHNRTISKQLLAMVIDDDTWLSEICDMMGEI